MSDGPWIRFFASDWLAGTRGLSAVETGIYITLIALMYEREQPIGEDPHRLARLCGTSVTQLKGALERLLDQEKLERVEGGLWNSRADIEIQIRRKKSRDGREAASRRWLKGVRDQGPGDAPAVPTPSRGNANQNPEPESSHSEGNPGSPREPDWAGRHPAAGPPPRPARPQKRVHLTTLLTRDPS
jgi:uncharacterized protein YdaU (DUF1376 family)